MQRKPQFFAFAAVNSLPDSNDTEFTARALTQSRDQGMLCALAEDPGTNKLLASRQLKFGVPAKVSVYRGRERGIVMEGDGEKGCLPVRHLGEIDEATADALIVGDPIEQDREQPSPIREKLELAEMQQFIIRVDPCGCNSVVYAIEVDHRISGGACIGSFTVLFVPPYDPFA